jgi:hypothetical protein
VQNPQINARTVAWSPRLDIRQAETIALVQQGDARMAGSIGITAISASAHQCAPIDMVYTLQATDIP